MSKSKPKSFYQDRNDYFGDDDNWNNSSNNSLKHLKEKRMANILRSRNVQYLMEIEEEYYE